MQVRIGITDSVHVADVEVDDGTDAEELADRIDVAVRGDVGLPLLVDRHGQRFAICPASIAFAEIDELGIGS